MIGNNTFQIASHLRATDANGNYITSNEKLLNYLQDPGVVPSILVLGEVERRNVENATRMAARGNQPQPPTVKEQAKQAIMGGMQNNNVAINTLNNNSAPQSPAERASSGIASVLPVAAKQGGYVTNLAGGGIVAFREAGAVSKTDPNARPFTGGSDLIKLSQEQFDKLDDNAKRQYLNMLEYEKKMSPDSLKNTEFKGPKNFTEAMEQYGDNNQTTFSQAFKDTLKGYIGDLYMDPYRPDAVVKKEYSQEEKDILQAGAKEEIAKTDEDYNKSLEKIAADNVKADKEEVKVAEKPSEQIDKDLNKFFEGAYKDTGKLDTSLYDELGIDQTPEEYRAAKMREREAAIGEDPTKKDLADFKELSTKRQTEGKQKMVGNFFLNLGKAVMEAGAKGKGPLDADFEQTVTGLIKDDKELTKMFDDDRKYITLLRQAQYKEEKSKFDYGDKSEQYAQALNTRVGLEKAKQIYNYDKLENELEKANISAKAYKSYIDYALNNAKLNINTTGEIIKEVDKVMAPEMTILKALKMKPNKTDADIEKIKQLQREIDEFTFSLEKRYQGVAGGQLNLREQGIPSDIQSILNQYPVR